MNPRVAAALARDAGIPLGAGVNLTFGYSETGEPIAVLLTHPHRLTGRPCLLHVWLEGCGCTVTPWRIVADDPLTIAPALVCAACGLRGSVTAGQWNEG